MNIFSSIKKCDAENIDFQGDTLFQLDICVYIGNVYSTYNF